MSCSHRKGYWIGPFISGNGSRVYAWCCNCGAFGYRYRTDERMAWWYPGRDGNRGDWQGIGRPDPVYVRRKESGGEERK